MILFVCGNHQENKNGSTFSFSKIGTRRERLKSVLYLRLKKRKTFFFGKKLEIFEKNFFRKMSRSAEKCKRGTLFDL